MDLFWIALTAIARARVPGGFRSAGPNWRAQNDMSINTPGFTYVPYGNIGLMQILGVCNRDHRVESAREQHDRDTEVD